jgi:hypothetical protein
MGKFNSKVEQLEKSNRLLERIVFEVRCSTVYNIYVERGRQYYEQQTFSPAPAVCKT